MQSFISWLNDYKINQTELDDVCQLRGNGEMYYTSKCIMVRGVIRVLLDGTKCEKRSYIVGS